MNADWIWSSLEIDPTDDVTAIRRAYARRLKQLDVDADPEAYAELRHARDVALDQASAPPAPTEDAPPPAAPAAPLVAEPAGPPPSRPDDDAVTTATAEPDPMSEHQRLFVAILFPDGERSDTPLDATEAAALDHHFAAMTGDPRLHDISWFGHASEWFAETLAHGFPRSQRLLIPAARFFDWASQDELRRSGAINWVLSRIEGERFVDEVEQRSHPLHKAWSELTRPTHAKSRRGKVPIEEVGELLSVVRTRYPHLEERFDWYRIQLWENPVEQSGRTWRGAVIWIAIVVLIQFVRFCDQAPVDNAPRPTNNSAPIDLRTLSGPSPQQQDDIDRVIRAIFDGRFGLADLKAQDPRLIALLEKSWTAVERDGGGFDSFRTAALGILVARYNQNLIRVDLPIVREHLRLLLREAEAMRAKDPAACADFLRGRRPGDELPPELKRERRALVGRILMQAPSANQDVADPEYPSFEIPGDVMADGARRASMPFEKFSEALGRWDAPARDRCTARTALMQAMLALPQEKAAPLLRDMMGKDPDPVY